MRDRFKDRGDAGRALAQRLEKYADHPDVRLLALPRGGVPVAYEIALKLRAPMDLFLVRKLGAPGHEEFAIGAMASGGIRYINDETVQALRLSSQQVDRVVAKEQAELERREQAYGKTGVEPDIRNRIVILIDDGLATGSTMRAAAAAVKAQGPARTIVAVPVAPESTCRQLELEVDEMICLWTPEPFYAVGEWYESFTQTSDEEVRDLLEKSRRMAGRYAPVNR
jgi:putative phosphoribosyl transferase